MSLPNPRRPATRDRLGFLEAIDRNLLLNESFFCDSLRWARIGEAEAPIRRAQEALMLLLNATSADLQFETLQYLLYQANPLDLCVTIAFSCELQE